MGESACLMRSFSHDSRIPNQPTNQGKHVHLLGESISFGRFTSESFGWEKWSSVPHKHYVEEAKSYAQPGSVAQKKAFFEAHYKKIAAQKAAAAALLEQEKAAAAAAALQANEGVCDAIPTAHYSETAKFMSHDSLKVILKSHYLDKTTIYDNLEGHVSVSDGSRTSQRTRPLLKSKLNTDPEVTQPMISRKPVIASMVSSIGQKPSRIILSPANYGASVHPRKENISAPRTKKPTTNDSVGKMRPAPKSLEGLMNSTSVRKQLNSPDVHKMQRLKQSPNSSVRSTPKRVATPMRTPTKEFVNGASKQPLKTPSSENRSSSKSLSTYKNKLQSPTISSPFVLRTEDRASRRKQKLEEKFNEREAQMQQQTKLKEKAEAEFRRLRESFTFKARPLPSFYKGRETPKDQIKKIPESNLKSSTPCRIPPSSTSSTKDRSSRRLWKSNDRTPTQHPLF